jgi:hypothetical protein
MRLNEWNSVANSCYWRWPRRFYHLKMENVQSFIHPSNQWLYSPNRALTSSFETPLDEWSARRRGLYLHRTTQHINIRDKQTSMPRAEFEPAIPATKRPQTHALDRAATGIGRSNFCGGKTHTYERGERLNVQIHILFCGDNSWTVALRQIKFGAVKDRGYTYQCHSNHYFVWWSFSVRRWCEMFRLCLGQTLDRSV